MSREIAGVTSASQNIMRLFACQRVVIVSVKHVENVRNFLVEDTTAESESGDKDEE